MDDGHEINISEEEISLSEIQRHKDVVLFLNDELNRLQRNSTSGSYNLESEYAKTKKNKIWFTWIVLASALVLVTLAAFFISRGISKSNREISVNVDVFEDLNLKSLVDSVQKLQSNYDNALKNKVTLQNQFESELKIAVSKREKDIFVIESLNLDDLADKKRRLNAVESEYNSSVKKIEEKYQALLSTADSEIKICLEQLSKYDAEKMNALREKELALDSERQLKELEQKELSEKYENMIQNLENELINERQTSQEELKRTVFDVASKYQAEINTLDPQLHDERAFSIIAANPLPEQMFFYPSLGEESKVLQELLQDKTVEDALNKFQSIYDDYAYIHSTVRSIPQKYSIPLYTAAESSLVNGMGKNLVDTASALHSEKVELKGELDKLSDEYNTLTENYNDLTNQYKKLDSDFSNFKQTAATDIKNQKSLYELVLNSMLLQRGWNAIVLSVKDANHVEVFVREDAVDSLLSSGTAPAEIVKTGKGTLFRQQDNSFVFSVNPDDKISLLEVVPGSQIKIFKK